MVQILSRSSDSRIPATAVGGLFRSSLGVATHEFHQRQLVDCSDPFYREALYLMARAQRAGGET